ncbi:hypothetical protein ACFQVC_24630 [Streptomyces monticola]|uniref:Integral membrane protein n=1 Tax=Streptomyces monticola TaxID=2666263 RepID=A0ABW2JPC1_9ACTN
MSFGDPNNPYGQQPGQGYPQAPPVQQPYGGGYQGGPMTMPGGVTGARVMLFVIAGLQVVGAILIGLTAAGISAAKNNADLQNDVQFQQLQDYPVGAVWAMAVFALLWGGFAVFLGAKLGSGGNGIRITTMVFGIITAILGIYPFIIVGLVHTVLAILITVFVGKSDGNAWFNRARY